MKIAITESNPFELHFGNTDKYKIRFKDNSISFDVDVDSSKNMNVMVFFTKDDLEHMNKGMSLYEKVKRNEDVDDVDHKLYSGIKWGILFDKMNSTPYDEINKDDLKKELEELRKYDNQFKVKK